MQPAPGTLAGAKVPADATDAHTECRRSCKRRRFGVAIKIVPRAIRLWMPRLKSARQEEVEEADAGAYALPAQRDVAREDAHRDSVRLTVHQ